MRWQREISKNSSEKNTEKGGLIHSTAEREKGISIPRVHTYLSLSTIIAIGIQNKKNTCSECTNRPSHPTH
jgi:hypothetical protein